MTSVWVSLHGRWNKLFDERLELASRRLSHGLVQLIANIPTLAIVFWILYRTIHGFIQGTYHDGNFFTPRSDHCVISFGRDICSISNDRGICCAKAFFPRSSGRTKKSRTYKSRSDRMETSIRNPRTTRRNPGLNNEFT